MAANSVDRISLRNQTLSVHGNATYLRQAFA